MFRDNPCYTQLDDTLITAHTSPWHLYCELWCGLWRVTSCRQTETPQAPRRPHAAVDPRPHVHIDSKRGPLFSSQSSTARRACACAISMQYLSHAHCNLSHAQSRTRTVSRRSCFARHRQFVHCGLQERARFGSHSTARNQNGRSCSFHPPSSSTPTAAQHAHHESPATPAARVRQLRGCGLKVLHELHAVDSSQVLAVLAEAAREVL